MTFNIPLQMEIAGSSQSEGVPTAKPGQSLTINLKRVFQIRDEDRFSKGTISIRDPFGLEVARIPYNFDKYTFGKFKFPIQKHLFSGLYTVALAVKARAFKDVSLDKQMEGITDDSQAVMGCFKIEGGHPPIVSHRVTYEATIRNTANRHIANIEVFIAVPSPLQPHQELLDLSLTPAGGQQANDLVGNNWIHFYHPILPARKSFKCGYTALIRNRSVRYAFSSITKELPVPTSLKKYTKPEHFIESHHHHIKDLAKKIASTHRTSLNFVTAAMRVVHQKLKYVPQKAERGAAFAIEKRVGDCTEFAALFAALCRAKGIPARLQAGFGFGGDKWERHAWAQVWLRGQWIPVDPTWHGQHGVLGINARHIPIITGNWMSSRIRQEFSVKWQARPGTAKPTLDAKWTVKPVAAIEPSSTPAVRTAPVRLQAKIPDAVPRGSRPNVKVTISPIPKAESALERMVLTATLSDGAVDKVVAIEPFTPHLSNPVNLTFPILMPWFGSRINLSMRLWLDEKPTSTVWQKSIGLI